MITFLHYKFIKLHSNNSKVLKPSQNIETTSGLPLNGFFSVPPIADLLSCHAVSLSPMVSTELCRWSVSTCGFFSINSLFIYFYLLLFHFIRNYLHYSKIEWKFLEYSTLFSFYHQHNYICSIAFNFTHS